MPCLTMYLPDDIAVTVDYSTEDEELIFDNAWLDGQILDTENLMLRRKVWKHKGVMSWETSEIISFARYFQEKLDDISVQHIYDDMGDARREGRHG
jgi:hypothetical protein